MPLSDIGRHELIRRGSVCCAIKRKILGFLRQASCLKADSCPLIKASVGL
jgi:hypothetical protein